jgi:guanine deaminase
MLDMQDSNAEDIIGIRGAFLTFTDDPFQCGHDDFYHYEDDGLILISNGKIVKTGSYDSLASQLTAEIKTTHYKNSLILPGFIDAHTHYAQTEMIGAFARQLLDWLNTYTFVTEQKFADKDHADLVANFFLDQCLAAGTTTAAVFCTIHPESVDALFEAAEMRNMRMIAGKVLMDRNAPEELLDTAQSGYDDSKRLIDKWHGKGRAHYCLTPRFAITSTEQQLEAAGTLMKEYSDLYLQSHISENKEEIELVKKLFPNRNGYLDVYQQYGLIGERTIYGHGVHLTEQELQICHDTGTALAHCPTSNLFLGSGLFELEKAFDLRRPVRVGLASDIGGGTSFSALQTLNETYKIAQLKGYSLDSLKAFYLATRGTAQSLYMEDKIGSIAPGMDADLVVLEYQATDLLKFRTEYATTLEELLFVLMTIGDDRATKATWIAGDIKFEKSYLS